MEYNTQMEKIIFPEYGRNLQKLVNKIVKIKNSKIKKLNLLYIINLMTQINKDIKDRLLNYKKRIWIQLHIISNRKIEIKKKYKVNKKILLNKNTKSKNFIFLMKSGIVKTKNIRFKYYGKILLNIIGLFLKLKKIKIYKLIMLLNLMKRNYLKWNKIYYVSNYTIYYELYKITRGKINILSFIYLNNKLY